MNESPRRRWFQFHLSTNVMLTLTVAVLMLVNTRPSFDGMDYLPIPHQPGMMFHILAEWDGYGWPKSCLSVSGEYRRWEYGSLYFDLAVAAAILTAVTVAAEGLARWRAAVSHEH